MADAKKEETEKVADTNNPPPLRRHEAVIYVKPGEVPRLRRRDAVVFEKKEEKKPAEPKKPRPTLAKIRMPAGWPVFK